jgi:hypothetical protein
MLIVGPYTKRSFTDRATANYASMLAYTERLFNLEPLGYADAHAYDYRRSFNYSRSPRAFDKLPLHEVPKSSLRYMATHPQRRVD